MKPDQTLTEMSEQLKQTKKTLYRLHHINELEAYARSEKFFKRDDEEIFVVRFCRKFNCRFIELF